LNACDKTYTVKHLTDRISAFIERLALALFAMLPLSGEAQPTGLLIDRVVGVVGREAILHSDLMGRMEQATQGGRPATQTMICGELEDLLYEKLLVEQGRLDSVVVEQGQVDLELDRRIRYFSQQLGGDEKLEAFYGKSVTEIKDDFRPQVHDQLLVQTMQQKVSGDSRLTPRDVQRFFDRIPEDSIPFINAEVEYAQLVSIPKPSEEEVRRVRRRIEEYREQVVAGTKDFCTVAILYSEDPGSAKECGDLGMVPAGVMVPEFDAVAMSLKENEVSQVFETQYGWHFMQLVERRGEQYHARHVLMRPQVSSSDLQRSRDLLDSLATAIRSARITFAQAAAEHSDDEESRSTNGVMIEPNSNSARWDMASLDQQTFFVLDKLDKGAISDPQLVVMPDGSKAYRLLQLLLLTEPHRANLKDDYRLLQQAAEGELRKKAIDDWVKDRLQATYVRVSPDHAGCQFLHQWVPLATKE
jgi:peptidyl-prolyl cis-trans isomerase SurA